jgi:hypothetical protein
VAIGGVACAVCAGIGGVTAVLLLRPRTDVRANAVASAGADSHGTSVSTGPTGNLVSEPPRASLPDEPPAQPSTPTASLRARPSWGKLDNVRSGNEVLTEYAPQLDKPNEIFMAAAPLGSNDVERGLLVCRVQTFAKADTFAGDDLQVRVAFGSTPLMANDGPEDANLGFVSAPLASLKKGNTVRFEVFDRDVWSLQDITRPQVTWNGGALTVLDPGATIECRGLSGESLNNLASVHAAEADQLVSRLQRSKLDGEFADWKYPSFAVVEAQRGVGNVAALVGWDDPRVQRRVGSFDAALASVNAQRAVTFDGLNARATGAATIGKITASNPRMSCAPLGDSCTVKVTVKNDGTRPVSLVAYNGLSFYAAVREGGPKGASVTPPAPDHNDLGAGESLDLDVAPPSALALESGPSLLGVCIDSHCQPVKLH